jgi:hypothetical protein
MFSFFTIVMTIKFNTMGGKDDDFIIKVANQADLIIEGGSGTRMWPFIDFRRFGFKGPYIRMDLTYPFETSGTSSTYTSKDGGTFEYLSSGGNCFRKEHVEPLIKRNSSKNSAFVSYNALANALFDEKHLNHWEKKSSEDRIPIPQAVEVLSSLPFKTQLHMNPAGFGTLVSREYAEAHLDNVEGIPSVKLSEEALILDTRNVDIGNHEHTDRFKTFIEESARRNWQLFLPKDDYDILYMTKQ